jgi:hypothetical protein
MSSTCCVTRLIASLILALTTASGAKADSAPSVPQPTTAAPATESPGPPPEKKPETTPETKVVLRISKEFIEQHSPPPVEHVARVDRCLFGSHVTGTAFTRGQASLAMHADDTRAVFVLHFTGTTTTRTVATKRPVAAYNTGVAPFDVHREIRFDGMQFSEGPESIEASYASRLDSLCGPPGLRGRIVRAIAQPQLEELRPRADAIGLADTKATVLESFGKETDRLVDELNDRVPWKQTLNLLGPRRPDSVPHFASTKEWILASPGPKDAKIPELPEESARMKAPIELWIHGTPDAVTAVKIVTLWNVVNRGLGRFRDQQPEAAPKITDIKPDVIGEWWVMRVGADVLEKVIQNFQSDPAI